MTPLRERFIRELTLRGCAERTRDAYVHGVARLAQYYHKSPDLVSDEEIKAFLYFLADERKLAPSSLNQVVSAVRAFQHLAHSGQRIFWDAVRRAGLRRHGGIHSLRHSFATHLIETGVEIPVVQRLLGHRHIGTTMIYLHVRQERLAEIRSPLQLLDLGGVKAAPAP